uniref:Secretion protein HlyD family protein n=1 Tax=Psychrobacter sp. (strain PRwf-1) TaxID=349106 RepID=A5WCS2_PSYWF
MSDEKYNALNKPTQTPPPHLSADTPQHKAPVDKELSPNQAAASHHKDSEAASTPAPDSAPATKSAAADNDTPMPPKEPIASDSGWSPKKKSMLHLILFVALIVTGVLLILYAWKLPPFTPTVQHTNNAFVKGRTTIISPQVSGYVTQVAVQDFAKVSAGDLLIKIDDRNFQQQLEQAAANIQVAITNRANNEQDAQVSQAQIDARLADLHSAQARVLSAEQDVQRYQDLEAMTIGAVSKAEVAHTQAQLAQAKAGVEQAQANLEAAQQARQKTIGSLSSLDANIKSAQAVAKQAQINLDNTIITAPESGQLSQLSVKIGQYVTPGTQLMYIVPKGVWVIANFKETQVANIAIGDRATIQVDALGGKTFTGRVSNLSPATGSELTTGSANPATGNYIKVAQRIPVRIDLDANQPDIVRLRPGMSVEADVDTKTHAGPHTKITASK